MDSQTEIFDGVQTGRARRKLISQEGLTKLLETHAFSDVTPFTDEQGQQKNCFIAREGSGGNTRSVFIAVDKAPGSAVAQMLENKGYNLGNEVKITLGLPVDEAILHGVNPLLRFMEVDGNYVAISPHFVNSKSLRRKVKEEGTLSKQEFVSVFKQVIAAEDYLISKGIVHRDLNPGNILLRGKGKGIESRLTDLATAGSLGNESDSTLPTGGQRAIRDPKYGKVFTNQTTNSVQNEMYGIAMDALFAINGALPVYYDFISGMGIETATGESLLDENGKIVPEKHNAAIDRAIAKLPRWAKRHASWIKKATQSEGRYQSFQQFKEDFEKSASPSLIERVRELSNKTKGAIAGGLVGVMALTGVGAKLTYTQIQKQHETEVSEARKYKVNTEWNGLTAELKNNIADLETVIFVKGNTNYYPKTKVLHANAGGILDLSISAIDKQTGDTLPTMPGRVYLEGVDTNDVPVQSFYISPVNNSQTPSESSSFSGDKKIVLPKNLPDGNYILAVELQIPRIKMRDDEWDIKAKKKHLAKVAYQGNTLSRKRIPIVVGKPSQEVDLGNVYIAGYGFDSVSFRDLREGEIYGDNYASPRGKNMEYEFYLFGKCISQSGDSYTGIWLPEVNNTASDILNVVIKENGIPFTYSGIPVERVNELGRYRWKVSNFCPEDMPKRIADFRKNYESSLNIAHSSTSEKTSK
ncbi:MAG: protein kinase [Nanoarchaeota archaeon]